MTTSSRHRLQALERRHRERGPCPACPPLGVLYQDDDGQLYQERGGQPFQDRGGQAAPPGPVACPACGRHVRTIIVEEVDDW